MVIEARWLPPVDLEEDAGARFALNAVIGGRELEAVITLRYLAGMTTLNADTPLEYPAPTRRPDMAGHRLEDRVREFCAWRDATSAHL